MLLKYYIKACLLHHILYLEGSSHQQLIRQPRDTLDNNHLERKGHKHSYK